MAMNGLALPSGPQMPAASVTVQEMDSLMREVRSASLYNRQLSSICQVNGLKSTGVKAELQKRITDRKSQLNSKSLRRHILPPQSSPPQITLSLFSAISSFILSPQSF